MSTEKIIIQFIGVKRKCKEIVEKITERFGISDDFTMIERNREFRYLISEDIINSDVIIVLSTRETTREIKRYNNSVSPRLKIPVFHLIEVDKNDSVSHLDEIRKTIKFPFYFFSIDDTCLKKQYNCGNLCIAENSIGKEKLELTNMELEKVISIDTLNFLIKKIINVYI